MNIIDPIAGSAITIIYCATDVKNWDVVLLHVYLTN